LKKAFTEGNQGNEGQEGAKPLLLRPILWSSLTSVFITSVESFPLVEKIPRRGEQRFLLPEGEG
jgi:hypothetical protein